MEVPPGPQAGLEIPLCINSHVRGLFTGHQSFLEGTPSLYTSNCWRNNQPESILRMGTSVLIEFPGALAPVFSGTSAALI